MTLNSKLSFVAKTPPPINIILPLKRTQDDKDRTEIEKCIKTAIRDIPGISFVRLGHLSTDATFKYSLEGGNGEAITARLQQVSNEILSRLLNANIIENQMPRADIIVAPPEDIVAPPEDIVAPPEDIGNTLFQFLRNSNGNIATACENLGKYGYKSHFGKEITPEMIVSVILKVSFEFVAKNKKQESENIRDTILIFLKENPSLEFVCKKLKAMGYTGENWKDEITPFMIVNALEKG